MVGVVRVMEDLTLYQKAELESAVGDFIADRSLDGLECVVLLRGRGIDILAYSRDATGPDKALALTESGRLTLAKHVLADTHPGPFN